MVKVKKSNGKTEEFSINKLERSLRNAGANNELIAEIVKDINSWITDGITTKIIYKAAFKHLYRRKDHSSLKYKLKQAIMELGPTGHPFETFIGKVLEKQGYKTEVALVIDGYCVTHEVDVIATKDHEQYIVECKYGQSSDKSVSVQVPLYVNSRVNDIIRKREKMKEFDGYVFHGMVATNTRFTHDSMAFSKCSGLYLLGWDYPEGNGLKDIIDREKVYPITILHSLTKSQKALLFNKEIVTCSQIIEAPHVLDQFELSLLKSKKIQQEIKSICNFV
ncbi:MAG: ATP cone domain-containing protein [Candidatus Delongbacteria bacterium]|jgi:Holliday junction resolvase-like predicted endonuclease|nr:ATP cone domain-containing protein [Candidatus Delongbacteria bacterium]